MIRRVHAAFAALLGSNACLVPRHLPPPEPPQPSAIEINNAAPTPPDEQSVAFETVERSAEVTEGMRTLCEKTPCVVHLNRGPHYIAFQDRATRAWEGTAKVDVGTTPLAYRYALGRSTTHPSAIIGGVLAVTGIVAGAASGIEALGDRDRSGDKALAMTGAGMLVAGIVIWALSMGEVQQGAGVQWTPGSVVGR